MSGLRRVSFPSSLLLWAATFACGSSVEVSQTSDGAGSSGATTRAGAGSSGGDASTEPPGCGILDKLCGGACVCVGDPSFDCEIQTCGPCAPPNAIGSCATGACGIGACVTGWADCDSDAANGCETSLGADPTCGACGVGCSNACMAGPCAVVELAADLVYPTGIAVDATNIYWGACQAVPAYGSIMTMPKGGGPVTTLAEEFACVRRVAIDTTHIYWMTGKVVDNCDGTVKKMPLQGGPVTTLAAAQCYPNLFILGADQAFWTTDQPLGSGNPHQILSMPLAGGGLTVVASGNDARYAGIAIHGTHLYWTSVGEGTVIKKPLAGGPTEAIYMGAVGPGELAVDAQHAYFTLDDNPFAVMRCNFDGSMPTTLATGQNWPRSVAVDATHVYWGNQGDADPYYGSNGSIMKRPIECGHPPRMIASGQYPGGIAIDETSIYWTNMNPGGAGHGSIRKAPK